MRNYLLTTPRWQVAVTGGLLAGIFTGVVAGLVLPFGWIGAVGFGAGIGVLFGASTAYSLESTRRQLRTSVDLPADALHADTLGAARSAVADGSVPADPEVRAAALALAIHQLEALRRYRTLYVLGVVVCGFSTVLSITAGFDWIDVLILAGGLAMGWQLYSLRRLRQRVLLLSAAGDAPPS